MVQVYCSSRTWCAGYRCLIMCWSTLWAWCIKHARGRHMHMRQLHKYISYGAGPRASQYLVLGAKCHALLQGKYSPDIEDVRAMALPVLRHRVLRNYKAEAEGITQESLIKQLL